MSQEVEGEEEGAKEGEESEIEEVEDEDHKPKEKIKEKESQMRSSIRRSLSGYHTGEVRRILQEFDQRLEGPPSSTSPLKASLNSKPSSMFPNGMLYLIFIPAVAFLQVYL